ncbi:polysaccharide biosynthesis/export family protein [Sphingomonas sp. MG17]|uniref:Polysaccharide biosynthesis/export family protein n=1 Tax=Sphingomonas tagetis TaxID=2949092 RepID=A0A9X2KPK2_9SPHN|nr:polysaccharide biosynthesis/export family protein [Sphingomonas tagetis]MCP3730813.1 polysaccharide biosynthesis/export family protein [Sphingomonas tagetis]
MNAFWGSRIFAGALLGSTLILDTTASAAQQPRQQGSAPAAQPYRINAGDEIEIYVWGEERLQRTVRVLPDGSFAFPLVGQVMAANRSPGEIEAEISKGLAPQFRNQVPQVTVSVRQPSGYRFSVVGKVRTPGSFTPGTYVNVLEAIAFAGGPSEFADTANVVILRKEGPSLTPIRIRLADMLKGNPSGRDLASNGVPELRSGDTVIVP